MAEPCNGDGVIKLERVVNLFIKSDFAVIGEKLCLYAISFDEDADPSPKLTNPKFDLFHDRFSTAFKEREKGRVCIPLPLSGLRCKIFGGSGLHFGHNRSRIRNALAEPFREFGDAVTPFLDPL
jgi:hypothetical protein